jgi:hypothetical protein
MGCYLEDYRARVGTWAGRVSWRGEPRHCDVNRESGVCLGWTVLSSLVLSVLLVTGGVEQNHGHVVEMGNVIQLVCIGCSRNLSQESNVNYVGAGIIIVVET